MTRDYSQTIIPLERLSAMKQSWDYALNLANTPEYDVLPNHPILPLEPPASDSLFYLSRTTENR